jgi:hypothetical protein
VLLNDVVNGARISTQEFFRDPIALWQELTKVSSPDKLLKHAQSLQTFIGFSIAKNALISAIVDDMKKCLHDMSRLDPAFLELSDATLCGWLRHILYRQGTKAQQDRMSALRSEFEARNMLDPANASELTFDRLSSLLIQEETRNTKRAPGKGASSSSFQQASAMMVLGQHKQGGSRTMGKQSKKPQGGRGNTTTRSKPAANKSGGAGNTNCPTCRM